MEQLHLTFTEYQVLDSSFIPSGLVRCTGVSECKRLSIYNHWWVEQTHVMDGPEALDDSLEKIKLDANQISLKKTMNQMIFETLKMGVW